MTWYFFQSVLRLCILMFHTPELGIAPWEKSTHSFGGTRVQVNILLSEGGMWPSVKSRNNAEGHFYVSAGSPRGPHPPRRVWEVQVWGDGGCQTRLVLMGDAGCLLLWADSARLKALWGQGFFVLLYTQCREPGEGPSRWTKESHMSGFPGKVWWPAFFL